MNKSFLYSAVAMASLAAISLAQGLSDAAIQSAIEKGKATSAKKLWEGVKKNQQFRLNRAGFGDPIEKKALLLSDSDRIALESAEAKRELRDISIDEIKKNIPLGVLEVLLEANCYNNLYAGSLPKWGPEGGVHVVLKVDGKVIQPIERKAGPGDSVSVLPQEHGVISHQGTTVTYTPLYRSALYERASQRAWFTFPVVPRETKRFTVTVISGEGKQKEKEIDNPFQ